MADSEDGLTRYLAALGRGERADGPEALLFTELRAIAEAYMRGASGSVTVQPTMLVNEAYLKLFQRTRASWNDRGHFFAVAAKAMRQILVDRARARAARRLVPGTDRVSLADPRAGGASAEVDLLELEDLMTELAAWDERAARTVELRFFGGLEMEEVAEAMSVSLSTAEREWRAARAWLGSRLRPGGEA